MNQALARTADQVFVCSPALLEPKQRLNPHTRNSPHGVDVDLFQQSLDPALPVAEGATHLRHPIHRVLRPDGGVGGSEADCLSGTLTPGVDVPPDRAGRGRCARIAVAVTQNDYIYACRRIVGSKLRVSYIPGPMLMAAAVVAGLVSRMTKVQLPLSPYRLQSSRPLGPFDCRAAKEVLGWTPRIGARRGLADTCSAQVRG